MVSAIAKWIKRQLSADVLASDMQRMIAALVPAVLTFYALEFPFTEVTGWLSHESITQAATLFLI